MKKVLVILLMLILSMGIVGCKDVKYESSITDPVSNDILDSTIEERMTSSKEEISTTEVTTTLDPISSSEEKVYQDITQPIKLKDCTIQFTDISLIPPTDEKRPYALRFTYDITNHKNEVDVPLGLFSKKVFQNGEEVEILLYNFEIDASQTLKDIEPGETKHGIQFGYDLLDMSKVEFYVNDYFEAGNPIWFEIDVEQIEQSWLK